MQEIKTQILFDAVLKSSRLLISDKQTEEVINEVLAILGQAAHVDRCYIFQNVFENGELKYMDYNWEWQKAGGIPQIDNPTLKGISWEYFVDLQHVLKSGSPYFTNVSDILNHEMFKESLIEQGIKSIVFTPIIYDNCFWGFIGFDDCTNERHWSDFEIKTLFAISANLGAYLKRVELHAKLEIRNKDIETQKLFYESILDNLPADVIILDKNQRYVYVNRHAIKDDEVRSWIIGKNDLEYCIQRNKPIELAQTRKAYFDTMLKNNKAYYFDEVFELADGNQKTHFRFLHPVYNSDKQLDFVIGYGFDISNVKQQEATIQRLTHTIENSPEGIAVIDKKGKLTYTNKVFDTIFGNPKSNWIGKHWDKLFANLHDNNITLQTAFANISQTQIWQGEALGVDNGGNHIALEVTLIHLSDGSSSMLVRDISPLKYNIALLSEANQKLNLAIDATQLGMWEWDLVTRKITFNDIFKKMFVLKTSQNFTDKNWLDSIVVEDREQVKEVVDAYLNDPNNKYKTFNYEYRINSSGKTRWILDVSKITEYDASGIPITLTGFCLDITKNKVFEEKIRNSEKRYRDLVENLREVIIEMDGDFRITYVNDAWGKISGYTMEQTIHHFIFDFVHEDYKVLCKPKIVQFANNKQAEKWHEECLFVGLNEEPIWLDIEWNKIVKYGQVVGYWGSMENITVRKNSAKILFDSLESERQLVELKSRFVSMASHEFRTPLSSIRTTTELIQLYGQKNPALNEQLTLHNIHPKLVNIMVDVDRIVSLMTDILTLGKIETGNVKIDMVKTEMNSFLTQYMHIDAARFTQTHKLHFNPDGKNIYVKLDSKLFIHSLNNLFSNATKYSDKQSEINVAVKTIGKKVQITVSDQGIGIPPEDLPHMFDSFYRSKNAEHLPGTGLGLPIAKYFIELHGGSIDIKSKLGEGTKVMITLPIIGKVE